VSNGTTRWSAPVGDNPAAVSVRGNLVYVLSADLLYAFNTGDGTLRWRQQLPYSLGRTATLLLDNGTLYAVNSANLTALRPDSGAIRWQFSLDLGLGESIKEIFLTGKTLLVWSPTTLDGLDAGARHDLWHQETRAKNLRVVGETVYTIFMDIPADGPGTIVTGLRALHIQDGQASSLTDETFFRAIGPTGGDVEARSTRDGLQLWQTPSGNTFVNLLAGVGRLYLEMQQGEVDAWRATDGNQLWQYQGASGGMTLSMLDHVLSLLGKDSWEGVESDPLKGTARWHLALGNSISAFIVS
jgi:outer membrane protein assembly factor BamB